MHCGKLAAELFKHPDSVLDGPSVDPEMFGSVLRELLHDRGQQVVHLARVPRDLAELVSVWRTPRLGIHDRVVECAQNVGKPSFFGCTPHDYMLSARSIIGRMICAHVGGAGERVLHRVGSRPPAISI